MEDETITPSDLYVKDFNNGYTLAREMPELADKLAKAIGKSERSGFQDGRRQFQREQLDERYMEKSLTKQKGREHGR